MNEQAYDTSMAVPSRAPEVSIAGDAVADAISYLQDRLQVLENRLSPVLRQGTSDLSVKAPSRDFASPLAQSLSVVEARIGSSTAQVSDLLERLEL